MSALESVTDIRSLFRADVVNGNVDVHGMTVNDVLCDD